MRAALAMTLVSATCAFAQTPPNSPNPPDAATPNDANGAVRRAVSGIVSYTHWPSGLSNVRLCVVGTPHDWTTAASDTTLPFAPPTSIKARLVTDDALPTQCDAVYVGALSDAERGDLFARIAGHPILTIDENDRACTKGAMFCIHVDDVRVSFDINLDSISRGGVRVSPRVLELARKLGTP
ncbi:YfiR family protein [Pararobbsia silviterrae]|uniref:YfiR family protein n=1 Tax=Pararobbsia silviterrae TaxID=1792498 RepID=UPI001314B662|nr:YfiR family protein [Pararobbsia silviterrae]